ncbi:MAG: hypothetical protein HYY78_06400 [Betaproteobacteria bacterium]|nr:hypothetical protein [Betaproteobacteria bacterium]
MSALVARAGFSFAGPNPKNEPSAQGQQESGTRIEMEAAAEEFAAVRSRYEQYWAAQVARLEQTLYRLHILKQGVELLLLVSSYLIYYFLDCIAVVIAMPLPLVR